MSRRLAIQSLSTDDVLAEIRAALADGLDATRIADYLASVDWSGTADSPDDDPMILLLGKLWGWETEYGEGDISEDEYVQLLHSLLSSPD